MTMMIMLIMKKMNDDGNNNDNEDDNEDDNDEDEDGDKDKDKHFHSSFNTETAPSETPRNARPETHLGPVFLNQGIEATKV